MLLYIAARCSDNSDDSRHVVLLNNQARLHQQARHDDRHAIGLGTVYTQLTIAGSVTRERFLRAAMPKKKLATYLEAHTGESLLPWARRTVASLTSPPSTRSASAKMLPMPDDSDSPPALKGKIWPLPADLDELDAAIRRAESVTIAGPALVTDAIAQYQKLVLLGEPGSGKSTALRFLALTLMALVHLNDGRLPEDRVTLYSRCIDILLAQWEQRGKDASDYGPLMQYIGLPDRDIQRLRPLLTKAAYQAHQAGTTDSPGSLGRITLRTMTMDFLHQIGHPEPFMGAERLLEYTDHRAGLIQANDAGDAYTFPHLTFQEYMAGLELTSGLGVVAHIMQHRHLDRWRVPIMLGVGDYVSNGKRELPYQLLTELINHPDHTSAEAQRDALFAAELALDVGWDRLDDGGNSFKKLRRDIAQALASVVEGMALPATERVRAGVILGEFGDLRAGVCAVEQIPFVPFATGEFQIGNTEAEYQAIIEAEKQNNLDGEAKQWYGDTVNAQLLDVAAFELARYAVTNAQWALFMAADGYNPTQPWWDTAGCAWLNQRKQTVPADWQNVRVGSARSNHPVIGISWYEATAFCAWLTQKLNDGYTYCLPSELEWEFACRGTEHRTYAWANEELDGERANFNRLHQGTTAVGCFVSGTTPEGLLDMAGNVWEWTRSEYRDYPYDPDDGREEGNEPAEKRFTLRGGGWFTLPFSLRASDRNNYSPVYRHYVVGLRLARHKP